MRKNTKLWLDDDRPAPKDFLWAKTYIDALAVILSDSPLYILSLDNDLGRNKEGYDVVKWMVEFLDLDEWPDEIRVHSANSVALDNMSATIERYGPYPPSFNGWIWKRQSEPPATDPRPDPRTHPEYWTE